MMAFFFLVALSLIPALAAAPVLAVIVHHIAKRRGIQSPAWTIGSAIPYLGVPVAAVFLLLTLLSVLDRLNDLERGRQFD